MSDFNRYRPSYYAGTSYFKAYAVATGKFGEDSKAFTYANSFADVYDVSMNSAGFSGELVKLLNLNGINGVYSDGAENNTWRQTTTTPTLNGVSVDDFYSLGLKKQAQYFVLGARSTAAGDKAYAFKLISGEGAYTWGQYGVNDESTSVMLCKDFNCVSVTGNVTGLKASSSEYSNVVSATVKFVSEDGNTVYASTTTADDGSYYLSMPAGTTGKVVVEHPDFDTYTSENTITVSSDISGYGIQLKSVYVTLTLSKSEGVAGITSEDGLITYGDTVQVKRGEAFKFKVAYKPTQRLDEATIQEVGSSEVAEISCTDEVFTTSAIQKNSTVNVTSIGNLVQKIDLSAYGRGIQKVWFHPLQTNSAKFYNCNFYINGTLVYQDSDFDMTLVDGYSFPNNNSYFTTFATIDTTFNDFIDGDSLDDIAGYNIKDSFQTNVLDATGSSTELINFMHDDGWYFDTQAPSKNPYPELCAGVQLGYASKAMTYSDFRDAYKNVIGTNSDKVWIANSSATSGNGYFYVCEESSGKSHWSYKAMNFDKYSTMASVVLAKEFHSDDLEYINGMVYEKKAFDDDDYSGVVGNATVELKSEYNTCLKPVCDSLTTNSSGYYDKYLPIGTDVYIHSYKENYSDGFVSEKLTSQHTVTAPEIVLCSDFFKLQFDKKAEHADVIKIADESGKNIYHNWGGR